MDDLPALASLDTAIRRYALVDRRHLELLHGNVRRLEQTERAAFLRELIADSGRVGDGELDTLLGYSSGWRERLVAAWMAGICRRTQQRQRIGELLIASRQTYAGQGYCFALACFATPADAQLLCDYLDRYLRRPELFYDQDWAIGALLHIDAQLGSTYAERFTAPEGLWWQWTRDKSPGHLEALRSRVSELRALVEEARQTDATNTLGQDIRPSAGWMLIPRGDNTVFEAELATAVAADLRQDHPLADRPLTAVAACKQRDHVLFEVAENPVRWVLVHFGAAGQPGRDAGLHWLFYASTETATAGLREHMC